MPFGNLHQKQQTLQGAGTASLSSQPLFTD
jgi:hypothetical protein